MESASLPGYEEILREDHESKDRWWFLRSGVVNDQNVMVGGHLCSTLEDTIIAEAKITSAGSRDDAISSGDPVPSLGDRQASLIDGFCLKYECGPEFRKDLLRLVLLLLSLPVMEAVSAECRDIRMIADYSGSTGTYTKATILCYCIAVVGTMFAFILSLWAHRLIAKVFSYVASVFGVRIVRDMRHQVPQTMEREGTASEHSTYSSNPSKEDSTVVGRGVVFDESTQPEDEDVLGLWKEWYDNLGEEEEHNLDYWSPK